MKSVVNRAVLRGCYNNQNYEGRLISAIQSDAVRSILESLSTARYLEARVGGVSCWSTELGCEHTNYYLIHCEITSVACF